MKQAAFVRSHLAAVGRANDRLLTAIERNLKAKERAGEAIVGDHLRCQFGDGGLHGPFQFAVETRTVTCRECGQEVDAFLWMLNIEVGSACTGDRFTHHDLVNKPDRSAL
jgi:hypothetical protein